MLKDSSEKAVPAIPEIEKGTATFADNVLTLAGGTTIALTVTVLASPITSRLFGPEAFGLASLFRSGAVMLAAIACLRYEMAIVLPKNDEDAVQLFALCYIILIAMTALTAILTYLFGTQVLFYMKVSELNPILWLFPIYVFLLGLQIPLNSWYTRQKQFNIKATNRILNSFPISIGEIGGGWAGFRTGTNLVVIRFFSLIISPAFLVWRLLRGDVRFIIRNVNPKEILRSAKKYIKFPIFDTWSILLAQLSTDAPILLLTSFFSPAICGLYSKATYLLLLPSIVIGKSVGQVFLQESAAAKAARMNLAGLFETVFNRMITIGTLPFAILAIIGPELFELFLGARWTESGGYAQILMPQIFLGFLLGSIDSLFWTLGKQELNLISNALFLFMRVAILIYGGLILRDVRVTLFIYMVANVLIRLWLISFFIRATKVSATKPITHFLRCIAYAVPSVMPIAAMKWWLGLEAFYLVALTPVFAIPYIALVLRHDLILRNLLSNYFRRVLSFKK
ncbi:MAG: lipopolysaccharide biosynthesis protein [Deltaproteobacteria bacterium]|nr:lipopolysaccharide biosynthesis protein [Deltaproteobacteria bacterium]